MTAGDAPDRRQQPRAMPPEPFECRLEVRARVRLVDISLTGAMLATDVPLPIGTPGQLRSNVGVTAFAPAVQVRRIAAPAGRASGAAVGAMFTSMDERSRRSLEEFLKKASD